MGEIILIDSSVIFDICSGNRPAALELRRIMQPNSGYRVYPARYAYLEMTGSPGRNSPNAPHIEGYPELAFGPDTPQMAADMRALLDDLNLRPHPAPPLVVDEAEVQRAINGRTGAANPQMRDTDQIGRGTRFNFPELNTSEGNVVNRGQPNQQVNPGTEVRDARIVAEASALRARIWTLDLRFRNNLLGRQDMIVGQQQRPGARDPRRLAPLRLGNLVAPQFNHIDPIGNGPNRLRPEALIGRRMLGMGLPAGPAATVRVPLRGLNSRPVDLGNMADRGAAVGQGSIIVLGGLANWFNQLNEQKQREEINKQFAAAQSEINERRAAGPSQGILVVFHFLVSEKPPQASAAVNPDPRQFTHLTLQSGATREEARRNVPKEGEIRQGGAIQWWGLGTRQDTEELWIEPLIEPTLADMKAPWTKVAIGTFAAGRAEVQQVEFAGTWGFDDEHSWNTRLPVTGGVKPMFLILKAPPVIKWTASAWAVDKYSPPVVQVASAGGGSVPAIDLDPSWPGFFHHVAAVPVYPADEYTANLFEYSSPTLDPGLILTQYANFNKVRWVRPQNLVVLQAVNPDGSLAPTPDRSRLDKTSTYAAPAPMAGAGAGAGGTGAGAAVAPGSGKPFGQLSVNARRVFQLLSPINATTVEAIYIRLNLGIPATDGAVKELIQERKVVVTQQDVAGNAGAIRATQLAYEEAVRAAR